MTIELPDVVASKARLIGADRWVAELSDLTDGLLATWSLTPGRVHQSGTEALVLDVTRDDGTPAVLKIMLPVPEQIRGELTVLRLTGGSGCARLLAEDESRGAMLLERLGPMLDEAGLPLVRRDELLADAAARVWRRVPDAGLPTGAARAGGLRRSLERRWEESGRACSEQAVEHALACAGRREAAHRDERALLLHGDVHGWNLLRAAGGWALIDPDGVLAEPEYDLGVILREDPLDTEREGAQRRVRRVAARSGCDPVAAWEWSVAERVSTGLLCSVIGAQPVGRRMLALADRLAAVPEAERDVRSGQNGR